MENQTHTAQKAETVKSESSILVHSTQSVKPQHAKFPTWSLIVVLIIGFFILKTFIYISDEKRHGK